MYKVGTLLLVTAAVLAASGAKGYTDSPLVFTADNGAVVTPIDAYSATVQLTAAGNTTISASAPVDGVALTSDPAVETAGEPATSIVLTVAPADETPPPAS